MRYLNLTQWLFLAMLLGLPLLPVVADAESERRTASTQPSAVPGNLLSPEDQLDQTEAVKLSAMPPPVRLLLDPDPPKGRVKVLPRDDLIRPEAVTANFQFTYVPEGQTDKWDEPCYAFPEAAKAAVERAGVIWGNILQSPIPITVRLCWCRIPPDDEEKITLGYSGGQPRHRNFPGAPRLDAWFQGALANSLAGSDLAPDEFDMHIAMNSNVNWYLGLDANPPAARMDFVTVMLHEIAHGLNFSGSMWATSGQAQWGDEAGYPGIYDVYMRDGGGNLIINTGLYPNPSATLLSAVTSDDLWFDGAAAMGANDGQPVKMYAPSEWTQGSSYSHLDYETFKTGPHRLMLYAVAPDDAVHDPQTITIGLLADLGWRTHLYASGPPMPPLNDTGQTTCSDDTSTHPRQDCTVGRDAAAAAGVLPKVGAGSKGFDYTKIANDGRELPEDAALGSGPGDWACTRDNLTGRVWEVKTNDGGLRDWNWEYTWYDDIHTDNNGGDPGSLGSATCGGTLANDQCNTQAYVAAVNAAGLCGFTDWRLPTDDELQGLVDYGIPWPDSAIDPVYFPNTNPSDQWWGYWSSSTYASYPDNAWYVYFSLGSVFAYLKADYLHVRLARGGQ